MTDSLDAHAHEIHANPSDEVMAALVDARDALAALEHTAMSVMCPGCDPDGTRGEAVRVELAETFDVDPLDAEMLLSQAADVRGVLMGLLMPPCGHSHEEQHDG